MGTSINCGFPNRTLSAVVEVTVEFAGKMRFTSTPLRVRIVDESGEDYLYPAGLFVALKVPHSLEQALSKAA